VLLSPIEHVFYANDIFSKDKNEYKLNASWVLLPVAVVKQQWKSHQSMSLLQEYYKFNMTVHTKIVTPPKSSKLRNLDMLVPAQEWKNRTPKATNLSIVHFLVLPGSQLSFTEITEYLYFNLIWSALKLQYKIE